jgi:hypothetical protein
VTGVLSVETRKKVELEPASLVLTVHIVVVLKLHFYRILSPHMILMRFYHVLCHVWGSENCQGAALLTAMLI